MRDSSVLPDLRMLPVQNILPHEDCDPRRAERLCKRILKVQRLKHPPIVAAIPGTDNYVVLDGANRIMAFKDLKIPHIVAQLISYADPGVELDTWYHVVSGMPLDAFETALAKIADKKLEPTTLKEARESLSTKQAAAYIVCKNGVRKVTRPPELVFRDTKLLNEIVGAYKGKADIFRASNDVWEKQAPYYPEITAIVVFPSLSPADIMLAVKNGERVPSGITRHIIPQRALNINIPLDILQADQTLEEKDQWLQDWLMERMADNAIRYYSETTFMFDEW